MSKVTWLDKINQFKTIDVREVKGNFFPGLKAQAERLGIGEGLEIIQSFEPYPLYKALEELGFEHFSEKKSEYEVHAYFCRVELKQEERQVPYRPIALLNYPMIDEELGRLAADFWNLTWNDEKRTLPYEMRLLLSLTNAVGAGRMRQAARELIKAYAHGVPSTILDDVFELLAWNQGIGYFSSEIGPSGLFKAYKLIKNKEEHGTKRDEIVKELMEKFGEKNEEISVS